MPQGRIDLTPDYELTAAFQRHRLSAVLRASRIAHCLAMVLSIIYYKICHRLLVLNQKPLNPHNFGETRGHSTHTTNIKFAIVRAPTRHIVLLSTPVERDTVSNKYRGTLKVKFLPHLYQHPNQGPGTTFPPQIRQTVMV